LLDEKCKTTIIEKDNTREQMMKEQLLLDGPSKDRLNSRVTLLSLVNNTSSSNAPLELEAFEESFTQSENANSDQAPNLQVGQKTHLLDGFANLYCYLGRKNETQTLENGAKYDNKQSLNVENLDADMLNFLNKLDVPNYCAIPEIKKYKETLEKSLNENINCISSTLSNRIDTLADLPDVILEEYDKIGCLIDQLNSYKKLIRSFTEQNQYALWRIVIYNKRKQVLKKSIANMKEISAISLEINNFLNNMLTKSTLNLPDIKLSILGKIESIKIEPIRERLSSKFKRGVDNKFLELCVGLHEHISVELTQDDPKFDYFLENVSIIHYFDSIGHFQRLFSEAINLLNYLDTKFTELSSSCQIKEFCLLIFKVLRKLAINLAKFEDILKNNLHFGVGFTEKQKATLFHFLLQKLLAHLENVNNYNLIFESFEAIEIIKTETLDFESEFGQSDFIDAENFIEDLNYQKQKNFKMVSEISLDQLNAVVEQEQYDRIPILPNYQELVDTICDLKNLTNLEEHQAQQDRIESDNEYFVKIDGNFFPCTSGLLFMITVIHKFIKIEGFVDAHLLADFLNTALERYLTNSRAMFFEKKLIERPSQQILASRIFAALSTMCNVFLKNGKFDQIAGQSAKFSEFCKNFSTFTNDLEKTSLQRFTAMGGSVISSCDFKPPVPSEGSKKVSQFVKRILQCCEMSFCNTQSLNFQKYVFSLLKNLTQLLAMRARTVSISGSREAKESPYYDVDNILKGIDAEIANIDVFNYKTLNDYFYDLLLKH